MDFKEFIDKQKAARKDSKGESVILSYSSSTTTASTELKLTQLSFDSSKSSAEGKNVQELLSEIKNSIKVVQQSDKFIKTLAYNKNLNLSLSTSLNFVLRLPKFKFNYKKIPAERTFKSYRNDISNEIWEIKVSRLRKKSEIKVYSEPSENIYSVTQSFLEKNIVFKPSGKRFSISNLPMSSNFTTEKSRTRNPSLFNPKLKEIIADSDSSSSSSDDYNVLPKLYTARQQLYNEPFEQLSCICENKYEALLRKDYKIKVNKPSPFADTKETYNKHALKLGYLTKRISKSNKFHVRWLVLNGFRLYWYRKHSSRFTKGKIQLGSTLVYQTEAGKEKCFAITGKERVLEFLHDKPAIEWKHIINSQICYKCYLDEFEFKDPTLLEYFQDLCLPAFVLENLEFTPNLFKYFSNALPAHSSLETLKLVGCYLGDDFTIELCEIIKGNCHIKTLDLSKNQLTSLSLSSIAGLIKQEEPEFNTIMNLNLSDNPQIKDEGIEQLAGAFNVRFEHLFLPNILHQLPFYSLKLNNIGMGDRGLNALNKIFVISIKMLQDEEIELKLSLEIGKNWFGSSSFLKFAENIGQFQGIESLNISECYELGDDDVVALAEMLSGNFSMSDLDISGISVTRTGFEQLFILFSQNYVLKNLKIQIDDEFKIAVLDKENVLKNFTIV